MYHSPNSLIVWEWATTYFAKLCLGVKGKYPNLVLDDLHNVRQLDGLFISYTVLAELAGCDSPSYLDYCLTAHAMIMQIWKVKYRHLFLADFHFLHRSENVPSYTDELYRWFPASTEHYSKWFPTETFTV